MPLSLKRYQQDALSALQTFLVDARSKPAEAAFQDTLRAQKRQGTYTPHFGDVPCVCIRVPTGGGKTLLAAKSIPTAAKSFNNTDAPIALWLTPSDAIRRQTLDALLTPDHPYRQALAENFGDRIRVCDLESLQTVGVHDVGKAAVIVVTTIQSLVVTDTTKRNVYSFFEELSPHFSSIGETSLPLDLVTEEDLAAQPFLTLSDLGRVKHSVANWLSLHRPIVIVDEAHNNRTHRFFTSIGRVGPSCVIEFTATPVAGNNVLYQVSAAELKTEQMIKLPIVLSEHPDGWEACLRDAVLTRDELERAAQGESRYIRPIALIQAAPRGGGDALVETVASFLRTDQKIPADQIAIATGSQRDLAGVDLFSTSCPIRYVITVEALKEGWDCSFAYVLASLQNVKSAKDVEQLLGRVLRMPYAQNRRHPALNRAYAHIVAATFAEAAANLRDRLVQNMGFEKQDVSSAFLPQSLLPTESSGMPEAPPSAPDIYIEVEAAPDIANWPEPLKASTQILETSVGSTVLLRGAMGSDLLKRAEELLVEAVPADGRASVREQFQTQRAIRQALHAPSLLGQGFAPIPQLCLDVEGELEVVERETLALFGEWSLFDEPVQLAGFSIIESVNSFEIDVNGERVTLRHVASQQMLLTAAESHVSEQDLVRWLDSELRQPDIAQPQLQAYLVRMMTHLMYDRRLTLTALVRAKFQLAQAIRAEISRLRQKAMDRGFQAQLFNMTSDVGTDPSCTFRFAPDRYPAKNVYGGSYEFQKHYYPVIHDLRERTPSGQLTEEFLCAQALDSEPTVAHWIRNIERQEAFSFWLPTSTDYFYPDFVAELKDGRILAVEYKGEAFKSNDDSREKKQVGHQWEQSSSGRCLFLFAVNTDDVGRNVAQQIAAKVKL